LHDKGDLGVEEVRGVAATSSGLARVSTEPAGDAPSSAVRGPHVVAEQVVATAELALGLHVRARQQPRRVPLSVAAVEVKEIVWEPTLPRTS